MHLIVKLFNELITQRGGVMDALSQHHGFHAAEYQPEKRSAAN